MEGIGKVRNADVGLQQWHIGVHGGGEEGRMGEGHCRRGRVGKARQLDFFSPPDLSFYYLFTVNLNVLI